MKNCWKWIIMLALQAALFYLFPLCAGPTDVIGMVVLMLCGTLLLSVVFGAVYRGGEKFAYPAAVSILFIPSIPIYYNMTALVHAVWYLVLAFAGVGAGSLVRLIAEKLIKR